VLAKGTKCKDETDNSSQASKNRNYQDEKDTCWWTLNNSEPLYNNSGGDKAHTSTEKCC
jgi:hypothetical protein